MMRARAATPADAPAIAEIYNQGIASRSATFDTEPREARDIEAWFEEALPIIVVELVDDGVTAFARASAYRSRDCYRGIHEFGVYTREGFRGRGAGRLAMERLESACRARGAWKLVSRVFVDNEPSRRLLATLGFREVGIYVRHAMLDERWRDVVIVEKCLHG